MFWFIPSDRNQAKRLAGWICLVAVLFCMLYCVYYRFSHPDLTETRLFLRLWPLVPVFLGGGIGFRFLMLEE